MKRMQAEEHGAKEWRGFIDWESVDISHGQKADRLQ